MEKGFIKLSRSFFNNKMWQAARKFSECEAWLDLIQSARFEASPTTSLIGSCEVTWNRGQYPASIRFLSKKWGQSERWVRKCLSNFKKEGMITIDNTQGVSVITLVNFDKYNTPSDTPFNTPNILNNNQLEQLITQVTTQVVTQAMKSQHTSDTNNKKEEKKNKEISPYGDTKKDAANAAPPSPVFSDNAEIELNDCYTRLASDTLWTETVCMNENITQDAFKAHLKDFFKMLQNRGETQKSVSDAKHHFASWLRIELSRERGKAKMSNKSNFTNYDNSKRYTEF